MYGKKFKGFHSTLVIMICYLSSDNINKAFLCSMHALLGLQLQVTTNFISSTLNNHVCLHMNSCYRGHSWDVRLLLHANMCNVPALHQEFAHFYY